MLAELRRQATGLWVRLLLILLIIAFAVWGIGDIFRASTMPGETVAQVGDLEVMAEELRLEARAALERMQEQTDRGIERSPELMQALYTQALQGAVQRRLIDAHADALGLAVSEETLAREIREDPLFQTGGVFDRGRFEIFLRQIGLTEAGYLARLRDDLLRQRLIEAVASATTAGDTATRNLHAYRNEERRGEALVVSGDDMRAPEPTDEQLQAFLEENASFYQAPEYRSVELVRIAPEDLFDEIAVSEEELRQAYEQRLGTLTEPERRTVVQLLAPDRETIERAETIVEEGGSFADALDRLADEGLSTATLGPLTRGDLPAPLDETVFALAEGEVSEPVQSGFGWHLMRVSSLQEERVTPLAEVREELEREIKLDAALDRLEDAAAALDDAVAAGETLAQAAQLAGGRYAQVDAIDVGGRGPQGEQALDPPPAQEIVRAIFTATEGEVSLLEQTEDGTYYVYRVQEIVPSRTHDLAEVREEVADAWRARERLRLAREVAEGLRGRVVSEVGLEELAREDERAERVALGPVSRDATDTAGLGRAVVAALFATPPGELADGVVTSDNQAVVVRTTEIIEPDAGEQLQRVQEEIAAARSNEILEAYQRALRERFAVEVDQRSFQALFAAEQG